MRRVSCFFKKNHSRVQNPAHWLRAVARAAPSVPMPSPKMKSGSRATFSRLPAPSPSMDNVARPSAFMATLSTKEAEKMGADSKMYRA